jgi:hypothetical protein
MAHAGEYSEHLSHTAGSEPNFRVALVLNRTRVLAEQWSWACSSARVRLSG